MARLLGVVMLGTLAGCPATSTLVQPGPHRELSSQEITALELSPIEPTFCAGDAKVPLRIIVVTVSGDRLVIDDKHADFNIGDTLSFSTTLGAVKDGYYIPPKKRAQLAYEADPLVHVEVASNGSIEAGATLTPDWRCDITLAVGGLEGEPGFNGEPSVDARTARDPDFPGGVGGDGGPGSDAGTVLVEVTDVDTPHGRLGLATVISHDPAFTLDGLFDARGGNLIVDLDGGQGGRGGDGGAGGAGYSPPAPCTDPTGGSSGGRGGRGGIGGRGGDATIATDRELPEIADRVVLHNRGGKGGRGGNGGQGGAAGVGLDGDGCTAKPADDGPRGKTGPTGTPGEDGPEPRYEERPREVMYPRGTGYLER